jgi:hypothetical protein
MAGSQNFSEVCIYIRIGSQNFSEVCIYIRIGSQIFENHRYMRNPFFDVLRITVMAPRNHLGKVRL